MLNHVDLCSGIGGFALGFEWAGLSRPVMFCDIEPWSRKVLAKHWPDVPIMNDVKELSRNVKIIPARGANTILTAGYPCQPFSQAGKRLGTQDERHIWPYIREIVAQTRPAWCVFENVYGHVSMGLDQVLSDMETDGYATRAFVVPACGVDAPHRRDRVWIIAHTDSQGEPDGAEHVGEGERLVGNTQHDGSPAATVAGSSDEASKRCAEGQDKAEQFAGAGQPGDDAHVANADIIPEGKQSSRFDRERIDSEAPGKRTKKRHGFADGGKNVADTDSAGRREQWRGEPAQPQQQAPECGSEWKPEPAVGRVAHGIPRRVDRLKGLGNAIVPQIAMQIGIAIRQCEAGATSQ